MLEEPVACGPAANLIGVLTHPSEASRAREVCVVLANAGMIHRIGPHRLYVRLARRLAARGFHVFRFDLSGIGDSRSIESSMTLEEIALDDTRAVLDWLAARRPSLSFVLGGICLGADLAFIAAARTARVAGAILVNGHTTTQETLDRVWPRAAARSRARYYRKNLFSADSWRRLVRGESRLPALVRALVTRAWRRPAKQPQGEPRDGHRDGPAPEHRTPPDWVSLLERKTPVLLGFAEGSTALDVYELSLARALAPALAAGTVECRVLRDCDHVFTPLACQAALADLVEGWCERRFPAR